MSSLDKLAIRGIRSFDPNDLSTIQFYTPLTVIVGHNGSGKTTIIECLKYATTGDMPPNTKGGAFVHDPSIAGMNEVKAVVKLRFYNTKRTKMMVERRVQVTKKKTGTGLTLKSLEGVINYAEEGVDRKKREVLSTKCAELNEEVPKQLGVSRAILDNVIFCHQEESNWPLSEPASLKKKFDDIFEATRYTKALDEIKLIRKAQAIELKVDNEKIAALRTDRERAKKLTEALSKLRRRIDAKSTEHDQLNRDNKKAAETNKKFYEQATKHAVIMNEHDTLKRQKQLTENALEQVKDGLVEVPGTDAELFARVANDEEITRTTASDRDLAKRRAQDEQAVLAQAERKRNTIYTSQGSLLAQQDQYERIRKQRQELIREASIKHEIAGFHHVLDEEQMRDFTQRLDEMINAQVQKMETMKQDARAADAKRMDALQTLKSDRAADERAKRTLTDQIKLLNIRITKLTEQLDQPMVNEGDITMDENALANARVRKADGEAQLKALNMAQYTRETTKLLRELEEQRDACHVALSALNSLADTRAKRELKREEMVQKNEAVDALIKKNSPAYVKYVKEQPSRETMESEVNNVVREFEKAIEVAEEGLKSASRSLQAGDTRITYETKRVEDINAKAEALKQKISAGLQSIDTETTTIEAAVKEAEEEEELARNAVMEAKSGSDFFRTLVSRGKKHHSCYGCDRALDSTELTGFLAYCKGKIERGPKELQRYEQELSDWSQQLANIKRFLPLQDNLNTLITVDLPAAQAALAAEKNRHPELSATVEARSATVKEVKNNLLDLQLLKRAAGDIVRTHRESLALSVAVQKIDEELAEQGSVETSEAIQARLTAVAGRIKQVKSEIDAKRAAETSQIRSNTLTANTIHDLELELSGKRQQVAAKHALERQRAESQAEVTQLNADYAELSEKLRSAKAPLTDMEIELNAARNDTASAEKIADRGLQALKASQQKLVVNLSEIRKYESEGIAQKLAQCQTEMSACDKAVGDAKAKIQALQRSVVEAERSLTNAQANLRNIHANIKLRKQIKELDNVTARLDAIDVKAAGVAFRKYNEDFEKARTKLAEDTGLEAKLVGEISTMEEDAKEKENELATEYKDVGTKFNTALIQLNTMKAANGDLEKFGKALDGAIMAFHGAKMSEINDSLETLWRKTYQGTDIDKIMIKSDAEGKGVGGRSYNYRVVMVKDGTEMDMRGRCSAGQKVLASIIIRLALSESFSTNCGILALDEPTTNLDKENIRALSSALAELIKEREGQTNFQLIVITHDEEFLETLGGQGVLNKYWRVNRTSGQTSTIERQTLS